MNATDIIGATSITAVWEALGGDPPEHGRARAFYRNGDNRHAVALNDIKGCWYDYRDNIGGGILALIQHVLGLDRPSALRWLSDFTGLPLENRPLTALDRGRFAHARQEATELIEWKKRLTEALKRELSRWWCIYHATRMHVVQYGFDSPMSGISAMLHEFAEDEIDRLQRQFDTLTAASFADLVPIFRDQKRRRTV